MAIPSVTAGSIMDASAALLNDSTKTTYTYVKQLPYLNMALLELQEIFQLNEIPVVDTITSSPIMIPANTNHLGFNTVNPKLPDDLIEPQQLWERQSGIDPFTPMIKLNSLPQNLGVVEINQFISYVWESQELRFLPANQNIDLKIEYIKSLFIPITTSTSNIYVLNSQSFLQFRNAGLVARFIAMDVPRAEVLDNDASLAIDRALGIGTKGRQNILTRRKPFRASYKSRTYR